MRFEANLIHPDDPPLRADGELDLPDDLAQLGDCLRDEALQLADRYPADRFGESIRPVAAEPAADANQQVELANGRASRETAATRTDSRGRVIVAGTFTTALIVAVVSSVAVWRLSSRTQPMDAEAVSGSRIVSEEPAAEVPSTELSRTDGEPSRDANSFDVPHATVEQPAAVFFLEATGPELEGLLDLWEQQSPERTKISI